MTDKLMALCAKHLMNNDKKSVKIEDNWIKTESESAFVPNFVVVCG